MRTSGCFLFSLAMLGCGIKHYPAESFQITFQRTDELGNALGASSIAEDGGPPRCLSDPPETLTVGDPVFITATIAAVPESVDPVLQVTASGAFEFAPGETGRRFMFQRDEGTKYTFRLRARAVGEGVVSVTSPASIEAPPGVFEVKTYPLTGFQPPRFLRYRGFDAQYQIDICSSARPGATYSLQQDVGSITATSTQLESAANRCPVGYRSYASALLTTGAEVVPLTIVAQDTTRTCSFSLPEAVVDFAVGNDPPLWQPSGAAGKEFALVTLTLEGRTAKGSVIALAGVSVQADPSDLIRLGTIPNTDSGGKTVITITAAEDMEQVPLSFVVGSPGRRYVMTVPGPGLGSDPADAG